MKQSCFLHDAFQSGVVVCRHGIRVIKRFPQAAQRQVGALGQEQDPPSCGQQDVATGVRPDAGQCLEQGGFATTGRPAQPQAVTFRQPETDVAQQKALVWRTQGQLAHRQLAGRGRLGGDRLQGMGSFHAVVEGQQTVHGGLPVCQSRIGIHQPGQRFLYLAKGTGGLHEPAQRYFLCEIARCGHQDRKHHGDLSVGCGKPGQELLPLHQGIKVGKQAGKAPVQLQPFGGFTAIQGD